MPMMAKMRSLAPWFMLTVGGLFVLFMVLSDSKVTDYFHQQKQNVGSVNGEDITYQEYSNLVDRARKNQEQAGQTIDENQMDFFRDQVWEALVTQKLIDKKIKELGIIVTDNEVRDALLGPNPPAMLKQQFTDSTGNFNRQMYETALRDPRNKQIIIAVEDQIKEQLIQQKLQNYIGASATVSEEEAKDNFIRQNIKMKANYIMIDPATIPDSLAKINDDDIKKYYDAHPDDYKQEAQRKVKYVLFRRIPSQADSVNIKKNLTSIVAKLKADTASFKTYVQIYSEKPYAKDTASVGTIPAQARDLLIKASNGTIVGPVETGEGYVVYRVVDKVKSKKEQVRASHILIKTTGNDKEDLQRATDIYNQIMKGSDFATLAKEKSEDGSKVQGGDLGWFGRGQMVKPFEDACFGGKVGVVQKPIKTQFGYHIIKVTDRSSQDIVVEKIVNKIQISGSTQDKVFQDATDFSYIAKKDGFDNEAKLMKYSVLETPAFTEEMGAIPGLGASAALMRFAFDGSIGDISDVYRVNVGYVVATITDVIKPGIKKIEEVKEALKNIVSREKKLTKAVELISQIRSKIGDTGDPGIAKSVWALARIDSTSEFTTAGTIPGIGLEYPFSEYAYKGDLNKWSQPVKGNRGAYLIYPKYRTKYDSQLFDFQKAEIKKQLINTKKSRYLNQWIQDLKKEAKIVDNRYLFFR